MREYIPIKIPLSAIAGSLWAVYTTPGIAAALLLCISLFYFKEKKMCSFR